EIYDALRYGTLAEARRRPYLYTSEAWPEDASRELIARQGLFRIQWALSSYFAVHGAYPGVLVGGGNAGDALLKEKELPAYPQNGFAARPMQNVDVGYASPGDFAYYAVDADGDGKAEDYWLLLHGAASS